MAYVVPDHAIQVLAGALLVAVGSILALSLRLSRITIRLKAAEAREAAAVARNWARADELSRHRDIVESCTGPVYRKDGAGRLTFANRAYRDTFGIGSEAIGNADGPQRLTPEPGDVGGSADARLMTAQGPRWFALDEQPVTDATGRPVETQVVARDVTERHLAEAEAQRRLEAAEAAESAKTRLLAAVTHEVRTPIGGVIGMMDLLLDTGLRPEQQSYANSARSSAAALLSMIDDLLDHASLEAGRLTMVERAYSLEALVQEVCELLGPRADDKGLSLAGFVARKVPPEILGDQARVRQVLLNLVGNAIKFTDHGGVIVEARPSRGRLEIAVRDTGRGIAAEDRDRIFGEFERARETGEMNGSGLGLAISRRLIEAMGGSVALASRRGRGSVFTISLPLNGIGAGMRPPALAGRRFVLASASAVTRRAVALTLRDEGAYVASFAKPRRVGAAIRDGAGVDGVLVDLPMLDRLGADLPPERLVVMLAPSERESLPRIRLHSGASYLIKPIRRSSLVARLDGTVLEAGGDAGPGRSPECERLHVLLAEDDEVTAMILRATIERLGHSVERVANGHEAIARAGGAPAPDLILVDINMPGLGGAAAAAAIRNREARLGRPRVPIVAMSAGLSDGQSATATAAGIDMLVAKPLPAHRVAGIITEIRRNGRAEQEPQQPQRLSQYLS